MKLRQWQNERVDSLVREDLGVAHKTITHWVQILEELYYHFRITPYGARHSNFLKKEPKLYDCLGYRAELQFIRNKRGEEVDFIVTIDHKPWFAVELKESDETPARSLLEFGAQLKVPYVYQVVRNTQKDMVSHGVHILSAEKFLSGLI